MSRNEATDNTVSSLNDVYASIDVLVDYAGKHLNLDPRDADWTRNRIFELFELDSYRPTGETTDDTAPDELLSRFRESCVAAGLFEPEEGPRYADVERVDVTEIPLQELKPARHGFPSFGVFYER